MEEQRGLACAVCYNNFRSSPDEFIPRNLNCGHTYCTGCLLKLASQIHHAAICCPTCKVNTPLYCRTNRGVLGLPKNFGVLEIIAGKDDKSPGRTEKTMSKYMCKEHDESMKVFCHTDNCLICIYCQVYGSHAGHECELASNLAKNERESLKLLQEKIKVQKEEIHKAKLKTSHQKSGILTKEACLYNRISRQFIALKREVEQREARLRAIVKMKIRERLKKLEEQERALSEISWKCEGLQSHCEQVLSSSDTVVVQESQDLENAGKDVTKLIDNCPKVPDIADNLQFHYEEAVFDALRGFGDIVESGASCDDSDPVSSGADSDDRLLNGLLESLEQMFEYEESVEAVHASDTDSASSDSDTSSMSELQANSEGQLTGIHISPVIVSSGLVEINNQTATLTPAVLPLSHSVQQTVASPNNQQPQAVASRTLEEEKEELLKELQREIDRLRLMGPIRLTNQEEQNITAGQETYSDISSDDSGDECPGFCDIQVRVHNNCGPSCAHMRTRTTSSTSPHQSRHQHSPRPSTQCSVTNCQYHVSASLQCRYCARLFCRHCAPASRTCNKHPNGHCFVKYKGTNLAHKIQAHPKTPNKSSNMCQRPRRISPSTAAAATPANSGAMAQWQCKRCTMYNDVNALICGACEMSYDYDPNTTSNVCPMCTLTNEPGIDKCELCETDLECESEQS